MLSGKANGRGFQQGLAPLDDEPDLEQAGYTAPVQDHTRVLYHHWFKEAEKKCDVDVGGEGLKNAFGNFENSWYVAAALTMTVGFAFLMLEPKGQNPGSLGDEIAAFAFVGLSLLGTINSVLGVWWAGHMLAQVYWHPAIHFSKFWFAAMNTTMGHAQQFAKIAMEQLVLALLPLSYLQFGYKGLALSTLAFVYFLTQLQNWAFLMQRMRSQYADSLSKDNEVPGIVDVAGLHPYLRAPHEEGVLGMLFCQIPSSTIFSCRWLCGATGDHDTAYSRLQPTDSDR